MAENLTEDQIRECREWFSLFTRNGSDKVTVKELGAVIKSLGQNPTHSQLRAMIEEADSDGDGAIDFDDFLSLMAKKMEEVDVEEELLETFNMFDRDRNGLISAADFRCVLASLGESLTYYEIDEIVRVADRNRDGYLTYEEFVRALLENKS